MDIYTKFNTKGLQDRQIDTLIGLSKGVAADGQINQAEAEFLQSWLIQNSHSQNPVILNLLDKVSVMLEDGHLNHEEAAELFLIMQKISGESSEVGEAAKASTLPVCDPPPQVIFEGNKFLFTGTCALGTRKQCQAVIDKLGGVNTKTVTRDLNYLIIGTYVTDSWVHESYGRKIEQAVDYRDTGSPIAIITENYWVEQAGL